MGCRGSPGVSHPRHPTKKKEADRVAVDLLVRAREGRVVIDYLTGTQMFPSFAAMLIATSDDMSPGSMNAASKFGPLPVPL